MAGTTTRLLLRPLVALLVLSVAILTSGCLWGVVKDSSTGAGLGGTTVTYTDSYGNSNSTTTDANGVFAFDSAAGPYPAMGPVTFDVSHPGYTSVNIPRTAGYDDGGPHQLSNLSTFWDVQYFELASTGGQLSTPWGGFFFPVGVTYDRHGDLYASDWTNCTVWRIAPGSTIAMLVAGTGVCGFSGDGGRGDWAQLNYPTGLAFSPAGDLAIADSGNCRIRLWDPDTGIIATLAGNGTCGFAGDGLPAINAQLGLAPAAGPPSNSMWSDVAYDSGGNVYISDFLNCRVRKVDTSFVISTVAGSGSFGTGCGGHAGDSGPATASRLGYPVSVAVDNNDDLFIAEMDQCLIRKVDSVTGNITTIAGDGTCTSNGDGNSAVRAELTTPHGLAVDAEGAIYISEWGFGSGGDRVDCRIRRIDPTTGVIDTLIGSADCGHSPDGTTASDAEIDTPGDIALNCAGDVAFSEALRGDVRAVNGVSVGGPAPDADHDGAGYMCE
jgi:NHL repeat